MKAVFSWIAAIIGITIITFALSWAVMGNEFFLYKFFAPRQEAVRREVFEQSKAYNQGMVQELQNMQFEYVKAPEDSKPALRKIILHRAADYPEDAMPRDLAIFIRDLKREEGITR